MKDLCVWYFDKHKKRINCKTSKKGMPEESNVENFFFVTFTFLMKSLCVNERWTIQQRAE